MSEATQSPPASLFQRLARRWRRHPSIVPADGTQPLSTEPSEAARDLRHDIANLLLNDLLRERRSERRWKWVRRIAISGAGVLLFGLYVALQAQQFGWRLMPQTDLVGVVRLNGAISATSEASAAKVVAALRKAFERDNVHSIVLAIDSPGGQPAEAERIAEAITAFKARHPKPITAVIANTGASAAYLVALRADRIVAGHYSLVGSVGAIIQSWDVHGWLEQHNIRQRVYASGELKNMLNPYTDMNEGSSLKAQAIVDALGERFASDVRRFRKDKLILGTPLATGEMWTGDDALRFGLIDAIGTFDSTVAEHEKHKVFDFGPNADNGLFPLGGASDLARVLGQLNAQIGRILTAITGVGDVQLSAPHF